MKDRHKKLFVVGYPGEGQCIYGGQYFDGKHGMGWGIADPVSLKKAKQFQKKVWSYTGPNKKLHPVIYKLVRVK